MANKNLFTYLLKTLTKMNSLPSWETLVNAAQIRKFEPIVKILEEAGPDILPDIWYHRKCRSIFTMKEDLQKNASYAVK